MIVSSFQKVQLQLTAATEMRETVTSPVMFMVGLGAWW